MDFSSEFASRLDIDGESVPEVKRPFGGFGEKLERTDKLKDNII